MSGASEPANRRASGPVLSSGFLVDLSHSAKEESFDSLGARIILEFLFKCALASLQQGLSVRPSVRPSQRVEFLRNRLNLNKMARPWFNDDVLVV